MLELENLSNHQLKAFALGCAERARQIFDAFAEEHDEAPSESLQLGWKLQGGESNEELLGTVPVFQQRLVDLIDPDLTDSATMYALESIHHALEVVLSASSEHARHAAECMIEAVENWAPSDDAGAAAQHGERQWQKAMLNRIQSNPVIEYGDVTELLSQPVPGRETDADFMQAELFVIDAASGVAKRLVHVNRNVESLKAFVATNSIDIQETEALVAVYDYERVEVATVANGVATWRTA